MARYDYNFDQISNKEEFEMVRKAHPNFPKSIILKADCVRRGVSFTKEAMNKIGEGGYRIF